MIHSGDVRLVLLSLKYRVVSFWTQNKTVLLSDAPPVRLTSPFFHRSSSHRLVLIACHQFVNDVIALNFCDNRRNLMTFPLISIIYGYRLEFYYNHLSNVNYTILFLSFLTCAGDATLSTDIE